MKALLLIGALLGFGIGLIFSWVEESPWPSALWQACLAAYLAGLLLRWWGRAWRKNLAEVLGVAHSASTGLSAASKTAKS
jgi:hypothetical protein